MVDVEIKTAISAAIDAFSKGGLPGNALKLFETLGYNTDRQNPFTRKTFQFFKESFLEEDAGFNEEKARVNNWKEVDLLFQLTRDEVADQHRPVDTGMVDRTIMESYLFLAIELMEAEYTRTVFARISREVNKVFAMPVMVLFKTGNCLTLSIIDRRLNKKDEHKDVLEKVTLIKDIDIENPHRAHIEILFDLSFDQLKRKYRLANVEDLHNAWQKTLSLSILNKKFYKDLQDWFYYAANKIRLPFKPDYINEKESIKNFLVRLLARIMFCWFVKEKGLIKKELLELSDGDDKKYPLTTDIDKEDFLHSNSYYRGVLQNVFFNALNKLDKKSVKDFKWTKYLHSNFSFDWLTSIPYLNGGIFDKLEEDNAKESIEDSVLRIPNFLFYGIKEEQKVTKGIGTKAKTVIDKVEHKGLNGIFKSYKFTLEENTPFEEDIALDPELLGLVFENLLAELDPNLEESTVKSIRKLTGSYFTPRKVILEMVNESLFLYLHKFIEKNHSDIPDHKKKLMELVYHNIAPGDNKAFCSAVVNALDRYKVLDPACGSGAFLMGMLHRMVDLLKLVDPENQLWIELKIKPVDAPQRTEFKKILTQHLDDYSRKLGIIRDSIYGIDIQPLAVQITKLRFFISLLIDQRTDKSITPMPNIETKIICADSLKNIQADLFSKKAIERLKEARVKYYQPDISLKERAEITDEIVEILNDAFHTFAQQITGKSIDGQNKVLLKEWFTHATIAAPFFNLDFFYPELKEAGGFDCAIGNPPYGGNKIIDEIRTHLDIESKDPYGAFIARFLNNADDFIYRTPLKHGGVLAFIVSDTFMTIKSHFPLRKLMMQNYIHKMLRVHPDTFRATVNTAIIICERNVYPEDKDGKLIPTFNENHICQMADLTNISIHDNYDRFVEVLHQTRGVDFKQTDTVKVVSNPEYAIYYYPQMLLAINRNLPFFVASPKLFVLMNDSGKNLKKEIQEINGKQVKVKVIKMNDKEIKIVKLGDIAEVNQGISTGQNDYYIRRTTQTGSYQQIDEKLILRDIEIKQFNDDEKAFGIEKVKFGGKHFIPFDKGSDSNSDEGWMPNYFVETDYFIDWSTEALQRMRNLTIAQRKIEQGLSSKINKDDDKKLSAALRNQDKWFKSTINFSPTGKYSPTFRSGYGTVSQNTSSTIVIPENYQLFSLGLLCSRFAKYTLKNFHNHTVHTQEGDVIEFPILVSKKNQFDKIAYTVENIISTQKSNPKYDYASHEQIEIDRLVYEAYGLNAEDIEEVENWYARRYPKLSRAQKENLRKLGKSDDYLVLYGLKKTK